MGHSLALRMLSDTEFQELLAYIASLDRDSRAVIRETFVTFLTGEEERKKKLLEVQGKQREHLKKLERVVQSDDQVQLATLRKKLGVE